jgi:hypothetical protein
MMGVVAELDLKRSNLILAASRKSLTRGALLLFSAHSTATSIWETLTFAPENHLGVEETRRFMSPVAL